MVLDVSDKQKVMYGLLGMAMVTLFIVFFVTSDLIWIVFAILILVGWLLDPESPKPSFFEGWNEWLLKNRPRRLNYSESDEKHSNEEENSQSPSNEATVVLGE